MEWRSRPMCLWYQFDVIKLVNLFFILAAQLTAHCRDKNVKVRFNVPRICPRNLAVRYSLKGLDRKGDLLCASQTKRTFDARTYVLPNIVVILADAVLISETFLLEETCRNQECQPQHTSVIWIFPPVWKSRPLSAIDLSWRHKHFDGYKTRCWSWTIKLLCHNYLHLLTTNTVTSPKVKTVF